MKLLALTLLLLLFFSCNNSPTDVSNNADIKEKDLGLYPTIQFCHYFTHEDSLYLSINLSPVSTLPKYRANITLYNKAHFLGYKTNYLSGVGYEYYDNNSYLFEIGQLKTAGGITNLDTLTIIIELLDDSTYIASKDTLTTPVVIYDFSYSDTTWNNFDSLTYLNITPTINNTIHSSINIDSSGDTISNMKYLSVSTNPGIGASNEILNIYYTVHFFKSKTGHIFKQDRRRIISQNACTYSSVALDLFNDVPASTDSLIYEFYFLTDKWNIKGSKKIKL